ncbi:hypothetical protein GCM10009838_66350 [Catenulispora subtropica]|uniref:Methyltransferase type 11 domain-containing protein n=1 Tax=Catenulispora subtropica TaxID=450798 RepID=A0ABP5ECX3_9ACTN
MPKSGALAHRRQLVAGLGGRVVEIGAGHGPNFALHPREVAEVLAVEPEATMRAAAAPAAPVPVRVVAGHAGSIPVPDGGADAMVSSLVLCSVLPDQGEALAEIVRVLRPGGELRFYEHVRSTGAVGGRLQDALTPLWRRVTGNCHPNRATLQPSAPPV